MRWFAWSFGRHPSWCERSRSTSLFVVPSDLVAGRRADGGAFLPRWTGRGSPLGNAEQTRGAPGLEAFALAWMAWRSSQPLRSSDCDKSWMGTKRRPLDDRRGAPGSRLGAVGGGSGGVKVRPEVSRPPGEGARLANLGWSLRTGKEPTANRRKWVGKGPDPLSAARHCAQFSTAGTSPRVDRPTKKPKAHRSS